MELHETINQMIKKKKLDYTSNLQKTVFGVSTGTHDTYRNNKINYRYADIFFYVLSLMFQAYPL